MVDISGSTDRDEDDAWVSQLREALAETGRSHDAPADDSDIEVFEDELDEEFADDEPAPAPATDIVDPWRTPPAEPAPEPATAVPDPAVDELRSELREVREVLAELVRRTTTFEQGARTDPAATEALEESIVGAVDRAMLRAQATGEGTARLETEVRVLEESVRKLSKQVHELDVTSLVRDRSEDDAPVEGEAVAWTDVMLLAHELRSRVDDLQDQQRAALRDLGEWQLEITDLFGRFRAELLDAVVALERRND